MKNKLAYLGFLGFIGIGGILLLKPPLFAFSPFFIFFSYRNVIPDELFWENVKRSAFRAFIMQILISSAALAIGSIMTDANLATGVMVAGLSFTYAIGIVVFAWSLSHYERKEREGMSE